jgi:hypothetical protein
MFHVIRDDQFGLEGVDQVGDADAQISARLFESLLSHLYYNQTNEYLQIGPGVVTLPQFAPIELHSVKTSSTSLFVQ